MSTFVETFTKKFAVSSFEDVFKSSTWPKRDVDPGAWTWLETYFEQELTNAYPHESVQLEHLHPTIIDENTLTIEARFVGSDHGPLGFDVEVPDWLAHYAIKTKLVELGAVAYGTKPVEMPLSVNWRICHMSWETCSPSYYTVYNVRATFRITDVTAKVI